jgi:hypothetical protein
MLVASMSVKWLRSDSSDSNWFVCINVGALTISAGCIDVGRMAPVRFFRFELAASKFLGGYHYLAIWPGNPMLPSQ